MPRSLLDRLGFFALVVARRADRLELPHAPSRSTRARGALSERLERRRHAALSKTNRTK